MIAGIKDRLYGARVRQHLANRLVEICGSELGEFTWNACITYLAMDLELSIIPKDFFGRLRKSELSMDDAAIATLDAAITSVWMRHRNPIGPDLTQTLALMEEALDTLFLAHMGKVVPRNGEAGRSLDDFATEVDQ